MLSFACTVLKTMCPVFAAWQAISAVSLSRISPSRTTSGSCRRTLRRLLAKVWPDFVLISIWFTPSIWYSTGSSIVMTFRW